MANRVYGIMWERGLLIVGPAAQGGGLVVVQAGVWQWTQLMIVYGPVLRKSSHNTRKLKTSQFLQTSSRLPEHVSTEPVRDVLDQHLHQRVPVLANIQRLHTDNEEEQHSTINNLINSKGMCYTVWGIRYWLVPPTPHPARPNTVKLIAAYYCGQPDAHLSCCLISILLCPTGGVDGLSHAH